MSIFTGAGVAIVTPFHEDGSVNYEAFKEQIERQIAGGTDAIIVCGTTGESSTLTHPLLRKGSQQENPCYCRNRFQLYGNSDLFIYRS